MRAVLGIGNPGGRYMLNRHNVGFMFLDFMAGKNSLPFTESKFDYYFTGGRIDDAEYVLIKPSTFVNNSGIAAAQTKEKYHVDVEDILVVCDDVNLEPFDFRVRASGGDGGHNGLSSIIYHLFSNQFPRIRIGIGADFSEGGMADYVLSDFNPDEQKILTEKFETLRILTNEFITGGTQKLLDANSKYFDQIKKINKNKSSKGE